VVIHPKNFHLFFEKARQPTSDSRTANLKSELMKIVNKKHTQRDRVMRRREGRQELGTNALSSFEYPARPEAAEQRPQFGPSASAIDSPDSRIAFSYSSPGYFENLGPKEFRQHSELNSVISKYTAPRHAPHPEPDSQAFHQISSHSSYAASREGPATEFYFHDSVASVQVPRKAPRPNPISSKIMGSTLNLSPGFRANHNLQLKTGRPWEPGYHQTGSAQYNN
jgi:hypothetical protein